MNIGERIFKWLLQTSDGVKWLDTSSSGYRPVVGYYENVNEVSVLRHAGKILE
jgi:hypothetical protein